MSRLMTSSPAPSPSHCVSLKLIDTDAHILTAHSYKFQPQPKHMVGVRHSETI